MHHNPLRVSAVLIVSFVISNSLSFALDQQDGNNNIGKFHRIKSSILTLEDIKLHSRETRLIRNNTPIAKVIVPAERTLTECESKALKLLNEAFGVEFGTYKLKKGQKSR